jgi:hypothetical protein
MEGSSRQSLCQSWRVKQPGRMARHATCASSAKNIASADPAGRGLKPIRTRRMVSLVIARPERGEPPCRARPSGRPGRTRRGVKVGIRFRLQGRSTAPSRQTPQVERESDQSTRKGRHQHSSSGLILVELLARKRPDATNDAEGLLCFAMAGGRRVALQ